MNWLQDIISKFSVQGLAVVGLAYFRDIGKGGVRTVTITNRDGEVTPVALNEDYNGYIRAINNANYRLREAIDCTANLYDVEQDVAIVMWVDRKVNPNGVMQAIQQAVAGNDILNTSYDKQVILNEEGLPENDYIMMKVVVRMVSEYAGSSCPADVCAVYYDPCFEVPNRPEPDPPVDPCGCECTVESGECCDYSVEGIELQTSVCITIPEVINVSDWGDTVNFSVGFSFGDENNRSWSVNFQDPFEQITSAEIIAALEELYTLELAEIFTYEVNGNTICIYPTPDYVGICFVTEAAFLNIGGTASTAITDVSLCTDYIVSGQFEETEDLCGLVVGNTCIENDHAQNGLFIGNFTFQVNINGEWTDVTEEVIDGTWTRENVCNGTQITEWRVIDSEDTVIDSGNVTANCTGTEETKSICEWITDHEERIQALEDAPSGGLTCETLQDCEVIGNIEDRLTDLEEALPEYVPYTGATQDVDLDTFGLDAKFLKIKGTNGAGHLGMKHQASNPSAGGQETVIFAGSDGEPRFKNDGNAIEQLASRQWVALQGFITNVITALGYTPENVANKSTSVTTDQASNTKYPSVKAVFDWAIGRFFDKPTGTTSQYIRGDGSLATFPTIPTAVSQLTNDSGYQTASQVTTAIANKFQFFADLANTSVNTNTTNNVIGVVLIPANTVTNNTVLEIESWISRAVGGANGLHRLMINTSNAFAGATEVARITTTTSSIFSKGERTFVCKTGQMRGFNATTPSALDDLTTTVAPTTTSVDWTVDQYILTVANNATGETTTHELTSVKVIKP